MEPRTAAPPATGHEEAPPDGETLERAKALLASPRLEGIAAFLRDDDEPTLAQQIELTEIPAPPFGEGVRATRMAELFVEAGLDGVETDGEGNVLARLGGGGARAFVVSAHLDTVFPAGTDVTVRRDGERLEGPGISDDGRGLAALLGLARALVRTSPGLSRPALFVATVGEEGAGDLRGVRHLFREGGAARDARAFLSLDGAGLGRLVTTGLGSLRYRIRVTGAGGHSWVDFGTPNPIHALGRMVARATGLELPDRPATSLTVGRWSGGTSINAIPREAWIELEVRSEGRETLDELDSTVRRLAEEAVGEVNDGGRAGRQRLELRIDPVGSRPAGATPPDSALVRAASAATRSVGATPELAISSTDANIPMSLGIPALTMGAGGEAGGAHTPDEWYRNVDGPEGVLRALLTLLLADEMEG